MNKYLALLFSAAFCLAGCGNGGGGSDICNALSDCGAAPSNCEKTFAAMILPGGCEEAVIAATCEDHRLETPSYMDLCFPPCGADSALCTGDIITACFQGKTTTSNCPGVCDVAGRTYSGVCADEYQGQVSESGMDVCWCQ